jgi:DNA replication protein DnaC
VSDCPDGRCDGSGFLYDESTRHARPCSCRPRRIARRKARKLAGVIPRRYQGVSFDRPPVTHMPPDVVRAVRSYVTHLDERLAEGRGIWFSGDVGTGKTTLAMLIAKTAMEHAHTVAIYSLPRLLTMLRETYREDSPRSLSQLTDVLCSVDLLQIDDIGAEQTTPWVLEQLYTVINTRYEEQRAVVLTTNLIKDGRRRPKDVSEDDWDARPDAELRKQIGERTVSRIYEMCGDPWPMYGDDQRLQRQIKIPERVPVSSTPDPFDDAYWEDDRPRYGRAP